MTTPTQADPERPTASPPSACSPPPETESPRPLPKMLPGVVLQQWVKCGKDNCRCARGQLHGPYAYLFRRVNGRLRKSYVRPADVEQVRAECEARQQFHRQLLAGMEQWRQMRDTLREVEQR